MLFTAWHTVCLSWTDTQRRDAAEDTERRKAHDMFSGKGHLMEGRTKMRLRKDHIISTASRLKNRTVEKQAEENRQTVLQSGGGNSGY